MTGGLEQACLSDNWTRWVAKVWFVKIILEIFLSYTRRCEVRDKKSGGTNDDLLDIGSKTEDLTGDELLFYEDQKTARVGRISCDIDLQYELQVEEQLLLEQEEADLDYMNYAHAMIDEETTD